MQTKKIIKVFKSTVLMIITTLVIVGIFQLIIGGIKASIDETETIASASKFSGTLAAGETAPGNYNVPSGGEFISKELNSFGGAPLITEYPNNGYCMNHKGEGSGAPVYKYARDGFDKNAWESLADRYYVQCTISHHDGDENNGFHIRDFPWKKVGTEKITVPQFHTGSKTVEVIKIKPNSAREEHTNFEVPTELYTPGYYKVSGTGSLSPAEAYVVSYPGGLSPEKQTALWALWGELCGRCSDSSLAKEAERYEKYDEEVRSAGGLNPQNTSTMVTPIIDIERQTYTLGPFSVSYIESGTSFDGGVSFAGITDITVQGYGSSGSSMGGGMSIGGSIILADGATGSTGSSNLSYFNPDGSEKVDRSSQVYPRSGQSFYVVISNPNANAKSEAECVTSISVKVKFKYMLAEGEKADLEGKQYFAQIDPPDHSVYEELGDYHWVSHYHSHTGHSHDKIAITEVDSKTGKVETHYKCNKCGETDPKSTYCHYTCDYCTGELDESFCYHCDGFNEKTCYGEEKTGHWKKCNHCIINVKKEEINIQGMMIADAKRTIYEQEIELMATVPNEQPTPTPTSTTTPTPTPTSTTTPTPTPTSTTTPTPTTTTTPPPTPSPTPTYQSTVSFAFSIAGNVWEDKEQGKTDIFNGLNDGWNGNKEINLKNIKVSLYFATGPQKGQLAWFMNSKMSYGYDPKYSHINPTYTDENGNFQFCGLDPMKKYYITFEYDGQTYTPTNYMYCCDMDTGEFKKQYSSAYEMANDMGDGTNHPDWDIKDYVKNLRDLSESWNMNSKATEKNSERTAFNNSFASIRSYPENYKIRKPISGFNLGTYNTTFTRLELLGYTLQKNSQTGKYEYVQTGLQLIDGYEVDPETGIEKTEQNGQRLEPKDGLISSTIRSIIETQGRSPSMNEVYSQIAGSNVELQRKLQFIEDCKITAYTKPQNSELVDNYDKYVVKNDYIEMYYETSPYESSWTEYYKEYDEETGTYIEKPVEVFVQHEYHEGIYTHAMHINLGLTRRPQTDLSLSKDVYKVGVTVNGQAQTYEYDSRTKDYVVDENGNKTDIEKPWDITVRLNSADYYSSTYNRALYKSDAQSYLNTDISADERLQVYVTYKLVIHNASLGIVSQIDEVVDYFDEDYDFVDNMSWAMYYDEKDDQNDYSITRIPNSNAVYTEMLNSNGINYGQGSFKNFKQVTSINDDNKTGNGRYRDYSQYGGTTESNMSGYNKLYVKLNDGNKHKLVPGDNLYLYLTFKVKDKVPAGNGLCLDEKIGNSAKHNIAEINGYTTWYNNNTTLPNGIKKGTNDYAGIIDIDSNPGNYIIAKEDDSDEARGIKIYADDDWVRKIDGTTWEDKRTYSPSGTNALIGNGVRETGEVGIAGIQVTLHEVVNGVVNDNIAQVYDNATNKWVPGTAITDANGKYSFDGYVPGDYVVRFTYNGETYNAQDYKSTSYQMNLATGAKIDQNGRTDISGQNKSGYVGYTDVEGQNEPGTYGYSIAKADNAGLLVSDAKDIWSLRESTNSKYANSVSYEGAKEQESGRLPMMAYTGVIRVEVEYNRESSKGNNQERNDNGIQHNNDNQFNGNYYIKDLDLGLEERPKAGLELNKQVGNVKITLANGTVLFDASQKADNLIWVSKHVYNVNDKKTETRYDNVGPTATQNKQYVYSDYTRYKEFRDYVLNHIKTIVNGQNGLIQATMDEEIMHGTTIQITYDMTVKNIGEEDYNDKSFYYLGDVKNKDSMVTTSADLVIDYVANNLKYEPKNNTSSKWTPITEADISANKYVSPEVQNAIKGKYNTILTTDDLNKKLKPLGSGNEEDSIDRTTLVLTQTITAQNSGDDLLYKNMAEIVSISNTVGRRMAFSIQGNQDPAMSPAEPDASRAEDVVILPPFGTHYLYIGLSIFVVAIIAVAVIVIKKTILKK